MEKGACFSNKTGAVHYTNSGNSQYLDTHSTNKLHVHSHTHTHTHTSDNAILINCTHTHTHTHTLTHVTSHNPPVQ